MQAIEIRFHAALNQLIANEHSKEAQFLADGKATDWADYKRRVGVLEGLERARKLAKQLADKDEAADRDLRQMMRGHE